VSRFVIIGAGVGGLTTAAILARQGYEVTVLEAHIYPGGCAGTFYHQGYRFDAGATLAAGFYPGGPMDLLSSLTGGLALTTHPAEPAMVVHLPGGQQIRRWTDERRWEEHRSAFGAGSLRFWQWQEQTADALWDLTMRLPDWPAQDIHQAGALAHEGLNWISKERRWMKPGIFFDAFQSVSEHLKDQGEVLRLFIDGQLLISAQATSASTYALYAAAALDLPRRGVVHVEGGMGAIAQALAEAVQRNGGKVIYRKEVKRIVVEKGRPVGVETLRGDFFPADQVIANLPPWNIANLLQGNLPPSLAKIPEKPRDGWGAFVAYVGFDGSVISQDFPLHHQVILREPFGEGNTIFLSISPAWDIGRAPAGQRAMTISTHTALGPWWQSFEQDRDGYELRKERYTNRLMEAAERIIPKLMESAQLIMPGTPVSFQRFTRRAWGWVGGYPQTSLFRNWGPRLAPGIWMVGDSIFPGQSTPAVALGGLRVANQLVEFEKLYLLKSNPVHHHRTHPVV
jgi:C-3',4' desaturase CrtD